MSWAVEQGPFTTGFVAPALTSTTRDAKLAERNDGFANDGLANGGIGVILVHFKNTQNNTEAGLKTRLKHVQAAWLECPRIVISRAFSGLQKKLGRMATGWHQLLVKDGKDSFFPKSKICHTQKEFETMKTLIKNRRNPMADALQPQNPNIHSNTNIHNNIDLDVDFAPVTPEQQRFARLVDTAMRDYQTATATRPAPVELLRYASGRLSESERGDFERQVELAGQLTSVVATVKAARPVPTDAALDKQLRFSVTKKLLDLAGDNPGLSPRNVLESFSQAAHRAILRMERQDLDWSTTELSAKHADDDSLDDKTKALIFGSLGDFDKAQDAWTKHSQKNSSETALAASVKMALSNDDSQPSLPQSEDSLASLTRVLSRSPRDRSTLLNILLDFSHRA